MQNLIPKNFQRFIAFATLLTFIAGNTSSAAPAISLPSSLSSQEILTDSLISNLEIPESLGEVKDRFVPQLSSNSIIHIQDAHASLEAQEHIRRILHYLKDQHDFNFVLVEGGIGELRADKLRVFKEASWNQELAAFLLKKGVLSGSERFLLDEAEDKNLHPESQPVQAHGVEDKDLYEKNLNAYRQVLSRKDESEKFADSLRVALLTAVSGNMNPKLQKFFKEWAFLQEHGQDMLRQLDILKKYADSELSLNFEAAETQIDWPQLIRFYKLAALKPLDSAAASKEHRLLKKWILEKKIAGREAEALLIFDPAHPDHTKTENGLRALLQNFYKTAHSQGFLFKTYPVLSEAWGREILREELDAASLFEEAERLTGKILGQLAVSQKEKELVRLYHDYLLLSKVLKLQLTDEDYEQALARKTVLKPSVLSEALKSRGIKISSAAPDDLFAAALDFYRDAKARDRVMFEKMIAHMKEAKQSHAVIVTGGFHSEGLQSYFKEKGIAFAEVQPRINDLTQTAEYEKIMLAQPVKDSKKSAVAFGKPAMDSEALRAHQVIAVPILEEGIQAVALEHGVSVPRERAENRGQESGVIGSVLERVKILMPLIASLPVKHHTINELLPQMRTAGILDNPLFSSFKNEITLRQAVYGALERAVTEKYLHKNGEGKPVRYSLTPLGRNTFLPQVPLKVKPQTFLKEFMDQELAWFRGPVRFFREHFSETGLKIEWEHAFGPLYASEQIHGAEEHAYLEWRILRSEQERAMLNRIDLALQQSSNGRDSITSLISGPDVRINYVRNLGKSSVLGFISSIETSQGTVTFEIPQSFGDFSEFESSRASASNQELPYAVPGFVADVDASDLTIPFLIKTRAEARNENRELAREFLGLLDRVEEEKDFQETFQAFIARLSNKYHFNTRAMLWAGEEKAEALKAIIQEAHDVSIFNSNFSGYLVDEEGDLWLLTKPSLKNNMGQKGERSYLVKSVATIRHWRVDDYGIIGGIAGALAGGILGGVVGYAAGSSVESRDFAGVSRRFYTQSAWMTPKAFSDLLHQKKFTGFISRDRLVRMTQQTPTEMIRAEGRTADASENQITLPDGTTVKFQAERIRSAKTYSIVMTLSSADGIKAEPASFFITTRLKERKDALFQQGAVERELSRRLSRTTPEEFNRIHFLEAFQKWVSELQNMQDGAKWQRAESRKRDNKLKAYVLMWDAERAIQNWFNDNREYFPYMHVAEGNFASQQYSEINFYRQKVEEPRETGTFETQESQSIARAGIVRALKGSYLVISVFFDPAAGPKNLIKFVSRKLSEKMSESERKEAGQIESEINALFSSLRLRRAKGRTVPVEYDLYGPNPAADRIRRTENIQIPARAAEKGELAVNAFVEEWIEAARWRYAEQLRDQRDWPSGFGEDQVLGAISRIISYLTGQRISLRQANAARLQEYGLNPADYIDLKNGLEEHFTITLADTEHWATISDVVNSVNKSWAAGHSESRLRSGFGGQTRAETREEDQRRIETEVVALKAKWQRGWLSLFWRRRMPGYQAAAQKIEQVLKRKSISPLLYDITYLGFLNELRKGFEDAALLIVAADNLGYDYVMDGEKQSEPEWAEVQIDFDVSDSAQMRGDRWQDQMTKPGRFTVSLQLKSRAENRGLRDTKTIPALLLSRRQLRALAALLNESLESSLWKHNRAAGAESGQEAVLARNRAVEKALDDLLNGVDDPQSRAFLLSILPNLMHKLQISGDVAKALLSKDGSFDNQLYISEIKTALRLLNTHIQDYEIRMGPDSQFILAPYVVTPELANRFAEKIRYISPLALPGAGKGTLFKRFLQELNAFLPKDKQYVYLETGDWFRNVMTESKKAHQPFVWTLANVKLAAWTIFNRILYRIFSVSFDPASKFQAIYAKHSDLFDEAIAAMKKGLLVKDETVMILIGEIFKLRQFRNAYGVFWDGSPRNRTQRVKMNDGVLRINRGDGEHTLREMDLYVILELDPLIAAKRIQGRAKEAKENGQPVRPDDLDLAVIQTRIDKALADTEPLMDDVSSFDNTIWLNGERSMDEVYGQWIESISLYLDRAEMRAVSFIKKIPSMEDSVRYRMQGLAQEMKLADAVEAIRNAEDIHLPSRFFRINGEEIPAEAVARTTVKNGDILTVQFPRSEMRTAKVQPPDIRIRGIAAYGDLEKTIPAIWNQFKRYPVSDAKEWKTYFTGLWKRQTSREVKVFQVVNSVTPQGILQKIPSVFLPVELNGKIIHWIQVVQDGVGLMFRLTGPEAPRNETDRLQYDARVASNYSDWKTVHYALPLPNLLNDEASNGWAMRPSADIEQDILRQLGELWKEAKAVSGAKAKFPEFFASRSEAREPRIIRGALNSLTPDIKLGLFEPKVFEDHLNYADNLSRYRAIAFVPTPGIHERISSETNNLAYLKAIELIELPVKPAQRKAVLKQLIEYIQNQKMIHNGRFPDRTITHFQLEDAHFTVDPSRTASRALKEESNRLLLITPIYAPEDPEAPSSNRPENEPDMDDNGGNSPAFLPNLPSQRSGGVALEIPKTEDPELVTVGADEAIRTGLPGNRGEARLTEPVMVTAEQHHDFDYEGVFEVQTPKQTMTFTFSAADQKFHFEVNDQAMERTVVKASGLYQIEFLKNEAGTPVLRLTNLGDEAVTLRLPGPPAEVSLFTDSSLRLKEEAPSLPKNLESAEDAAAQQRELEKQQAMERALAPMDQLVQRAQIVGNNTWDVKVHNIYFGIRTEGHDLLVSLKSGDVEAARKRVEEFVSKYQDAVNNPPAPVSRDAARRRSEKRQLTPEIFAVSEAAYEMLPIWTPEETAAALKVIREQNARLEEQGAAKLNAMRKALRETLGEKYGRAIDPSQTKNNPVHLALPVDRSTSPADLALLVTLITSPNDEIYLFLQGEGAKSADEFQRELTQALARMEVTPKLLKQIQVVDISSPKHFSAQIQRLLGPLQKDTVSGVATSQRSLLEKVPAMRDVRKMFGEKLKHPYALAFIAMMALRAEKQAAQMGQIFDLNQWMTQNGLDADFSETIARAMEAMKRVTAAA